MNAPVLSNLLREAEAKEKEGDGAPPPERSRRIVFLTLGAIAAIAIALFVITRLGDGNVESKAPDQRQAVSVIQVAPRSFTPTIALSGEARPVRDIHVVAPTTGVRILEILADEGQIVRAGQPLARLDTAVSNAQTRAAQASVAEARSAAIRARDEYTRAEAIRDSGALSAEAINQRKAAAEAADARLAAAQAQLAEVNARLAGGYVRAPIAGLVIDRNAQLGMPVDGQTLFRIAGDNALEVAAQVAEADILALRDDQPATFHLVDGTEISGRLRRTAASIDTRTRTGEALFTLPRDTRARAGMFLRGEAQLPARQALAVPQAAILYQGPNAYVFVIERRGEEYFARRTPVRLGLRAGAWVEVTSGLTQGAGIAGAGAAFLQHGDPVRAIPQPTQPQPRASGEPGKSR